ncbi:ABC-2 transporter permease [Streptococcus devriesei]|uniref:ABC-2 transporter permease n=1 Tax=Streptococcus devriesei TaxID=231233 RepID=UPI000422D5BC|nr:ABC-2 transporter permease [Streptococcus devriesei]
MKNLFKKDLLSSGMDFQWISIFFLILSIALTVFKLGDYFPVISYLILILAPLMYFLNIFNYTEIDYYKSELFFPIKIYKVVLSRYITYAFITTLSLFYILGISYVRKVVLGESLQEYQVNTISLGVAVALFFASFVLAGSFVLGNKNIKTIGIASFALTLIPIRIFMELCKYFLKLNNVFDVYRYRFLIFLLIITSIVVYIISFFISLIGFPKRLRRQ